MSTYVVSDIHGLKNRYDDMLRGIAFSKEDTLYVLGDVVDRGPDGIEILLDIMNHVNIILLMGNHEHMMMEYLDLVNDEQRDEKSWDIIYDRWQRNHCSDTVVHYLQLPKEIQMEVVSYLHTLPVAIPNIKAGKYMYYLVHGKPVVEINDQLITQALLIEKDIPISRFIWDRVEEPMSFFMDSCVIVGHTPTMYIQEDKPYQVWTAGESIIDTKLINIDCGCACNDSNTQLACLRLEDRKVFYF